MAFSAMEIIAGYAGSSATGGEGQPLLAKVSSSQSMTSAGTSTISAPADDVNRGRPIFYLLANADCYVALGSAPNAGVSPRFPVQANIPFPIYAEPGDKVAWVAA